jgi:hypothetical protein
LTPISYIVPQNRSKFDPIYQPRRRKNGTPSRRTITGISKVDTGGEPF